MTQSLGTTYSVTVPSLADNASITDAFKFYHQGGTSGSPTSNSIEQYLTNLNNRAQNIENAIGYSSYDPISPATSLNARVTTLESSVGSGLAATYVKAVPSSNTIAANRNLISPNAIDIIPLQIQGIIGQTADLQQWRTSASTVARVDSAGKIYAYNGIVSGDPVEVATVSGTQTFTNKTLLTPIQTIATNSRTASYTLVLSDQSKVIEVNSTSATTVTIPADAAVDFPIGTYIIVLQINTGQVTIAGSGFTPSFPPSLGLKLRERWSMATLIKRGANSWVVSGDVSA